ncbi:hypothetical protein OsI_18810 [Oryza sativa Indica Group]|uniref:F-box domain-containing protein n=1 Tax=Oryza sativa subsp. indica TaxID=39946 RepID=A2Y1C7_ORYSI|nr:hypothetical protein OsI_18810 [Oryza sativa Indica Group]
MDAALCDDLLQEVFRLLPRASAPAVSLVSRRWYALLRASIASLTLRLPVSSDASVLAPLSALLSRFPYLSAPGGGLHSRNRPGRGRDAARGRVFAVGRAALRAEVPA